MCKAGIAEPWREPVYVAVVYSKEKLLKWASEWFVLLLKILWIHVMFVQLWGNNEQNFLRWVFSQNGCSSDSSEAVSFGVCLQSTRCVAALRTDSGRMQRGCESRAEFWLCIPLSKKWCYFLCELAASRPDLSHSPVSVPQHHLSYSVCFCNESIFVIASRTETMVSWSPEGWASSREGGLSSSGGCLSSKSASWGWGRF